jgi:imidazolonepropionase-like amidohydrolase
MIFTPLEILRSATSVNASILRKSSELGTIAPQAFADLIVVDGDPLRDIRVLGNDGANLSLIMKGGRIHKSTL